jgi:hypothetical protein
VVLSLLFSPLYSWLRRRLPTGLALLIMLVVLIILFVGLFFILGASISKFSERVGFYTTQLNGQLDSLDTLLESLGLSNVDIRDAVKPSALAGAIGSVLGGVADFLSNLFLILIIVLFLLAEGPAMMSRLRASAGSDHPQLASMTAFGRGVVRQLGLRAIVNLFTGAGVVILLWSSGVLLRTTSRERGAGRRTAGRVSLLLRSLTLAMRPCAPALALAATRVRHHPAFALPTTGPCKSRRTAQRWRPVVCSPGTNLNMPGRGTH